MRSLIICSTIIVGLFLLVAVPVLVTGHNHSPDTPKEEVNYANAEAHLAQKIKSVENKGDEPLKIYWSGLRWAKKEDTDYLNNIPSEINKILNRKVALVGYIFALDWSKEKVSEFLLMPSLPSCMHSPLPSSDQIILVKSSKLFELSTKPVIVEGILKVKKVRQVQLTGRLEDITKTKKIHYFMDASKVW